MIKFHCSLLAYYSGGKGGGTGTYGSIKWDYSGPSRTADWNATIENNETIDEWKYKEIYSDINGEDSTVSKYQQLSEGQGVGILRNSVNNQWTIGLISKLRWEISERFKMSFGIDGRTAQIEHYREVRDLLGGTYFSVYDADGNRLLDEIDYTDNPAGDISYEYNRSEFWGHLIMKENLVIRLITILPIRLTGWEVMHKVNTIMEV